MRKPLSMLSVLALSVGIAMSAAPAQAALPSLLGSNQEMPSLAPVLEQVTPAVVNISVSGKKITRQRLPEQFKFFFGPNMPDEQVSEQQEGLRDHQRPCGSRGGRDQSQSEGWS